MKQATIENKGSQKNIGGGNTDLKQKDVYSWTIEKTDDNGDYVPFGVFTGIQEDFDILWAVICSAQDSEDFYDTGFRYTRTAIENESGKDSDKLIETVTDISLVAGSFIALGMIQVDDSRELLSFIRQLAQEFEKSGYDEGDYMLAVEKYAEEKLIEKYGQKKGNTYCISKWKM